VRHLAIDLGDAIVFEAIKRVRPVDDQFRAERVPVFFHRHEYLPSDSSKLLGPRCTAIIPSCSCAHFCTSASPSWTIPHEGFSP